MDRELKRGPKAWVLPLNEKYYTLDEEEEAFFKAQTRIDDADELKRHIIAVQTKAFEIYPYPCIRIFEFARLKMSRLPAYGQFLKLGKERKGAVFIDLGCCFGNDVRKAVHDGYPVENAIATDIQNGLWDLGHEMFRSTPESFPVPFIQGDILDPSFLQAVHPFTKDSPCTTPAPALNAVTSLNSLRGHVSAVFSGAFYHLFSETDQERIARAFACLLSHEPGSMLFGVHGGRSEKGFFQPTGSEYKMFCHSPESWKLLWEDIFGKGVVEVKAQLRREIGGDDFFDMYPGNKHPYYVMEWSVTRI